METIFVGGSVFKSLMSNPADLIIFFLSNFHEGFGGGWSVSNAATGKVAEFPFDVQKLAFVFKEAFFFVFLGDKFVTATRTNVSSHRDDKPAFDTKFNWCGEISFRRIGGE